MQSLIEDETNPFQNVIMFGSYCFAGVTALSYVSYRSFKAVTMKIKIDRPAGQRLQLSKMASTGGLGKAVHIF